jgi:hypothetical protein
MKHEKTITLTLTENEFQELKNATADAWLYWKDRAESASYMNQSGAQHVERERSRLHSKFVQLYNKTFLP